MFPEAEVSSASYLRTMQTICTHPLYPLKEAGLSRVPISINRIAKFARGAGVAKGGAGGWEGVMRGPCEMFLGCLFKLEIVNGVSFNHL